jgi:hypothetical protein
MKTIRGIPGGMFCENHLMLVYDMLKKKKKNKKNGISRFRDGYVKILLIINFY